MNMDCVFCEVESEVRNNIYEGWSENKFIGAVIS